MTFSTYTTNAPRATGLTPPAYRGRGCRVCKWSRRATVKELYEHFANNWCEQYKCRTKSDEALLEYENDGIDFLCCEEP